MKTAILITIIGLIFFCFIGGIKFQWKPFELKLEHPVQFFAWLFLTAAIICFRYDAHKEGFNEGYHDAWKEIKNEIDKSVHQMKVVDKVTRAELFDAKPENDFTGAFDPS